MARRFWPGQDALGKRFNGGGTSPYREVIGIARDVRNVYLWTSGEPYLYLPLSPADSTDLQLFVRTQTGNSSRMSAALRESIREIDGGLQVSVHRLEDNLALWLWPSQLGAVLSVALGLFGLLLAAAGIYSVMAYAVNQRTREIAIRMALGSQSSGLLGLLLEEGMRLVGTGVVIGLVTSISGARLLSKFLYGLSAFDGLAFAGVALLLTGTAFVACYIPARRAIRVDPIVALRYQ